MDLYLYFLPIIKWWRLIVVGAVIAAFATLVTLIGQPPAYESSTTLMIGQSISNPNPSSNQFYLEQDLAKIYADVAGREPIRTATRQSLGLESLPFFSVRALPNTQFIEIIVRDTDPVRAQQVAAELANQLINNTPANLEPEELGREDFVSGQLSNLQADILEAEEEITSLELQLGDTRGAREIADIERQIAALEDKVRSLQSTYASLILTSQEGAINSLRIIEPAEISRRPIGSNRIISMLMAAGLGAGIAVAGAYLIEYLDQRINHTDEITRWLDWPILALVEDLKADGNLRSHVTQMPDTSFTNAFRTIRTKLEVMGVGESLKTILVTGPAVAEGKSTVANNLARIFASGTYKVLLIDGDFKNPARSEADLEGFTDLLSLNGQVTDFVVPTATPRLSILHAGRRRERSLDTFPRSDLDRVFHELEDIWDVIVIDGPPAFVADALTFATMVDGFINVVRIGHTKVDAIKEMKGKFEGEDVSPLGIVVNGVSGRPSYYQGYYHKDVFEHTKPQWRRRLDEIIQRLNPSRGRNGISASQTRESEEIGSGQS
jgi:capsular exopolysaccharide synthesis family protein